MKIQNRITNDNIVKLNPNEIFVFGSNLSGIHGAGAAKLAYQKFGAIWGEGIGELGNTYAIPTKNYNIQKMSIMNIKPYVKQFIKHAKSNPNKTYLVTQIGCGLAGYKPKDIAPLFVDAIEIENIHLPLEFWNILKHENTSRN